MKSYSILILLLMLLFAPASAAAQEVNTVHVGNPQNAAALGKQVQQAYQNGARMIMINPGIYHLPAIGRPTFNLEGWKNATISAYHVTLIMRVKNAGNCFELAHCRNVRIEGPLISQTKLTFYQGRVISAGYIYIQWAKNCAIENNAMTGPEKPAFPGEQSHASIVIKNSHSIAVSGNHVTNPDRYAKPLIDR